MGREFVADCWKLKIRVSLICCCVVAFPLALDAASISTSTITCKTLPPLTTANISESSAHDDDTSAAEKLSLLLNEGMTKLPFEKHNRSAIMILGNTGSGKTTFSLTMNGNLSRIQAVKTQRGRLVIVDDDDFIGMPTTRSKTLVPHYVVNPDNGQAFYDCPGFDDNRGVEADIAAMYFVKSITRHVNRAKFLFLVTSSSVRLGNDRLDFELLATHASTFLQNLDKLSDSIGLIVTKVSNYNEIGEWNTNELIIDQIVEFLEKFKTTLEERLSTYSSIDDLEYVGTLRKMKFVDALLRKDPVSGEHNRIWFLRNPPKCGPYDSIPYAKEVRKTVTNLYQNHLKYADVVESDFGFTLKTKTMLEVERSIVPSIQSEIENSAVEMIDQMEVEYLTDSGNAFEQQDDENQRREAVLTIESNIDSVASTLLNYDNSTNITSPQTKASKQIAQLFSIVARPIPTESQEQIVKREGWLEFFKNVTSGAVQVDIPRPRIDTELHNFQESLRNQRDDFHAQIKCKILPDLRNELRKTSSEIVHEMGTWYLNNFYSNLTDIDGMPDVLSQFDEVLKQLGELKQNVKTTPMSSSKESVILAQSLSYVLSQSRKIELEEIEDKLHFYENAVGLINFESEDVQDLTTLLLERLKEKRHYYDWLVRLDDDLGGYGAQLELGNWRESSDGTFKTTGVPLSLLNEKRILSNAKFISELERSTASPKDKSMLEKVISVNTQGISTSCPGNGKAVIKGRIIRFSEFIKNYQFIKLCNYRLTHLDVLATNKLFLDCDVPAKGMNLVMNVIAPKWEVVGPQRNIIMDGSDGPAPASMKAGTASGSGGNGYDGLAGTPGGNAGDFIGAFKTIKNDGALTITSNGGNGGPGQNGGDGNKGKDGRNRNYGEFPNAYSVTLSDGEKLYTDGLNTFAVVYGDQWFRATGKPGQPGGNGGNGGVGGESGFPGSIFILRPANLEPKITFSARRGNKGSSGSGRLGAQGGKRGNHYWCKKHGAVGILWWDKCHEEEVTARANWGSNGYNGGSTLGFYYPVDNKRRPQADWDNSLANFKSMAEQRNSRPANDLYNFFRNYKLK